ncbi:unnamed protein product [Rotaria magnacalcarata]|uniref:Uncharacterized protein n=1 Tax=Rotaria magnacalcarata TaxID=392030 RepID=A0A816LT26_9BILA|nr:unnamed protein product [Rotaria magnacalcarata]CAF1954066.1 unnamed protein product [Rotaria magnacalcarata]CAF4723904.1 unnamed protein product [Rotaria magnacalcarata]CAF5013671.1 unnamed protein product [Rotaria magnacalcarata]
MAVFFDLIARPNNSIKSKTTREFLEITNPPDNLKVPNDWDVKPGDVISWSDFRATETYFVTSDYTLLKNRDICDAGYLTIPLSITSLFPDAVDHFSSVLDSIGLTCSSNSTRYQHFPLNSTKLNDIIEWILVSNEPKAKFHVKFNFQGKEICNTVPRGVITGLPVGWRCEKKGSLTFSEDKIEGEWKCEGPEKIKDNARLAIEHFYQGLNIEII